MSITHSGKTSEIMNMPSFWTHLEQVPLYWRYKTVQNWPALEERYVDDEPVEVDELKDDEFERQTVLVTSVRTVRLCIKYRIAYTIKIQSTNIIQMRIVQFRTAERPTLAPRR